MGLAMNYTGLRDLDIKERQRICGGLLTLRGGLSTELPPRKENSLLLATWNIREFGGTKNGPRTSDAMYYIAECISHFDLVAVQEVRADLKALKQVLRYLGPQWDVIYTDVSYADSGNFERLAFVFNKAKVSFTGLAGELVLPSKAATQKVSQIARTPFICGFQVGWARFNLCTVHIYYGKGVPNDPRRVDEIELLSGLLSKKAKDYINLESQAVYSPEHMVLLGDFNVFKRTDETFKALLKNKFEVPDQLHKLNIGSNVKQDKFYDQIAFYKPKVAIENTGAGIFDFYKYVFNDWTLFKHIGKAKTEKAFNDWRTYQMSDHLIMWSEFSVDRTEAYLKSLCEPPHG